MYIFSAGNLTLDNQLVCSPWGRTPPPPSHTHTVTFPQSPIVLCRRLRSQGLSPVRFGVSSSVVLVQLRFGQACE